jgi:hypothetical protein
MTKFKWFPPFRFEQRGSDVGANDSDAAWSTFRVRNTVCNNNTHSNTTYIQYMWTEKREGFEFLSLYSQSQIQVSSASAILAPTRVETKTDFVISAKSEN